MTDFVPLKEILDLNENDARWYLDEIIRPIIADRIGQYAWAQGFWPQRLGHEGQVFYRHGQIGIKIDDKEIMADQGQTRLIMNYIILEFPSVYQHYFGFV